MTGELRTSLFKKIKLLMIKMFYNSVKNENLYFEFEIFPMQVFFSFSEDYYL